MSSTSIAAAQPQLSAARSRTTTIMIAFLVALFAALFMVEPALAQIIPPPGSGGTGTATAATTRITTVVTDIFNILFVIGGLVCACGILWVAYGMMLGGKRFSDFGNVFYGAMIGGMATTFVSWWFI